MIGSIKKKSLYSLPLTTYARAIAAVASAPKAESEGIQNVLT